MGDKHHNTRSFEERLNTWVQIVGILIAAGWAAWTFIYKEIEVPKSAPVNISLNLQLNKIETATAKEGLTAVELKVSATNPSSREVYLLPNAWVAYGGRISVSKVDEANFAKAANDTLKDSQKLVTAQRHMQLEKRSIIATGHLFADTSLKPNETTNRTLVFYVPKQDYDLLYLSAWMPTAAKTAGLEIEWTLDESGVRHDFYRRHSDGSRVPVSVDKEGKQLDLQEASAQAEISL